MTYMRFTRLITLALLTGGLFLASVNIYAQAEEGESGLELETCELLVPGTPLSTVGECGWMEAAEPITVTSSR